MATDHTPHSTVEEREDDRLLDIWLFTLFALGVFIFVLFAAPRGCGIALQEKPGRPLAVTLPNGATLSLHKDSLNSILRTDFERKGLTKQARNCLNVSVQLHLKRFLADDNCH